MLKLWFFWSSKRLGCGLFELVRKQIRSSTGLNINWLSPIGPIAFSFAQNLKKADTDKTQSFSFNLGTTF